MINWGLAKHYLNLLGPLISFCPFLSPTDRARISTQKVFLNFKYRNLFKLLGYASNIQKCPYNYLMMWKDILEYKDAIFMYILSQSVYPPCLKLPLGPSRNDCPPPFLNGDYHSRHTYIIINHAYIIKIIVNYKNYLLNYL